MNDLSPEILENLQRLKEDFVYRCETLYKIRPKTGGAVPFKLNFAQKYLHDKLEDMRKRKGRVRAVILKARQQGVSTYVAARFFDKVIFNGGLKAFILAHREDATNNLYGLVERYYQNLPEELKRVKLEEPFNVNGELIMFVGAPTTKDGSRSSAQNVVNCRCVNAQLVRKDKDGKVIRTP